MASNPPWRERDRTPKDLPSLARRLFDLGAAEWAPDTYAFRGIGHACYRLLPTLVHQQKAKHDDAGLKIERDKVEKFRQDAWRFLGGIERAYLRITSADPTPPAPEWDHPSIWDSLAIARHYGVPTRLVDWTKSPLIAAYFAACGDPKNDGAVWWFNQSAFERALDANDHQQWKAWNVPRRDPTDTRSQRAMEKRAFDHSATPWISKVHHGVPFDRMRVQQGFFTATGHLDLTHDQAIDDLHEYVPRGRVIIRKTLKDPLLNLLEGMGIHAKAIDFPRADHLGWESSQLVRRRRPTKTPP